jgi:hypothetical protein
MNADWFLLRQLMKLDQGKSIVANSPKVLTFMKKA